MSIRGPAEARQLDRRGRSRRDARRARRRRAGLVLVGLLVSGLAFFAGLAVGRALDEEPRPGETQTLVRTLVPATIAPAPETVTVTTGAP